MGTCYDYTFRFEGDDESLSFARELVSRIQAENAEYSGNGVCDFGFGPKAIPGGFEWFFFTNGDVDDFMEEVENLVLGNNLPIRVYAYMESTDGQCWCNIEVLDALDHEEDGGFRSLLNLDDAALGIASALSYERCARGVADETDLIELCARFGLARSDGWDEDNVAWLLTAGACARALGLGLQHISADSLVWELIEEMEDDLRQVRTDLADLAGFGDSEMQGIDGLLAIINMRKIFCVASPESSAESAGTADESEDDWEDVSSSQSPFASKKRYYGVLYDFAVRFEGDEVTLVSARNLVEQFRMENARWTGQYGCDYGAEPRDIPGGFEWHFRSTGGNKDFDAKIRKLTKASVLHAIEYIASQEKHQCMATAIKGNETVQLGMSGEAALDLDTVLALGRCENGQARVADFVELRAAFDLAVKIGWSKDDGHQLKVARVCAQGILDSLKKMATDAPAWAGLDGMEENLRAVKRGLIDIEKASKWDLAEIEDLLTLITNRKNQHCHS